MKFGEIKPSVTKRTGWDAGITWFKGKAKPQRIRAISELTASGWHLMPIPGKVRPDGEPVKAPIPCLAYDFNTDEFLTSDEAVCPACASDTVDPPKQTYYASIIVRGSEGVRGLKMSPTLAQHLTRLGGECCNPDTGFDVSISLVGYDWIVTAHEPSPLTEAERALKQPNWDYIVPRGDNDELIATLTKNGHLCPLSSGK